MYSIKCEFAYFPVNTVRANIFFVRQNSMSALSVVNLLHLGQTHCLHCRLTLLILSLSCANDCIITSYDTCNMLQLWYLITISFFHELLILCFNQQFFSFGGTSLSEFKRIKTFCEL